VASERPGATDMNTVLFYVQHLLGIGHVYRATRIARALASAGARVHLAWGGSVPRSLDLRGLEVTFLEPLRSDGSGFERLVALDGGPVIEAHRQRRRDALLALLERLQPDAVMTETFPFGRRQLRFELEPLMQAARAAPWRPLTVSSIRDILQEGRRPQSVAESMAAAQAWFDLVLVHGDPALIRIEATLPGAQQIADKVRYTGLVTPDPSQAGGPPSVSAPVVVSAGSGAVGHALTEAALDAPRHCRSFPAGWLIIVGPERNPADTVALAARAPPGVTVVREVPDLVRVFTAAAVSVSGAGYNTVGEVLRAGCPGVLVPYSANGQTEQPRRARMLQERGLTRTLDPDELSAATLGAAVDAAAQWRPQPCDLDLDGASSSARLLLDALDARRRSPGAGQAS
jgi:predicted glycosyltransferase